MRLPALDQVIELKHGEPGQLLQHLLQVGQRMAFVLDPQGHGTLPAAQLLALPALHRLTKRLQRLNQLEATHVGKPRTKPRALRLAYDELIAIRLFVPVTGQDAVLGKVQQKSLNLAAYVQF